MAGATLARQNPRMNVIPWKSHETVKCPPGSYGWHPEHGAVRVLRANGWKRVIEVRAPRIAIAANGRRVEFPERRLISIDVRELATRAPGT